MERENRAQLHERVRAFLERADRHFRSLNLGDGTLAMHAAENEEMIRQSNALMLEIEVSNERQREEDATAAS